jgi:hypothetical protein
MPTLRIDPLVFIGEQAVMVHGLVFNKTDSRGALMPISAH